ncbi:hypothetical protein V8E54_004782 [Elaphomyces granulatus]|jgi:hypothetical protein
MPRFFGIGRSKSPAKYDNNKVKLSVPDLLTSGNGNSVFRSSSSKYMAIPRNPSAQQTTSRPEINCPSLLDFQPEEIISGSSNLETPPPYSPSPPQYATITSSSTQRRSNDDSAYEFLREFDTIFVVDDSSSMRGRRWKEAEEAIAAIAPICTQYDPDGIDIYFLNHRNNNSSALGSYDNITTASGVQRIFKSVHPAGATPFGRRLHQILEPYMTRVEAMAAATDEGGNLTNLLTAVRPLNIIAITDGEFTDDAESIIVRTAKRLDSGKCKAVPWQVGIQFFQVGNDQAAREYLEELDDELASKVRDDNLRDIVDTVPWRQENGQKLSGDGILKVVLGAVHKKYDKRKAY